MKSNREYIAESELNQIDDLIKRSDLSAFVDAEETPEDFFDQDDDEEVSAESFPGAILLRMDPLKMHLYLDLKAPVNSDSAVNYYEIRKKIDSFGEFCSSVVDWHLVQNLYIRVIEEGEIVGETLIARGKPVKAHIPEHIIIKSSLNVTKKPEIIEGNRVDFHHIKSFLMVQKGEFLGDIIPDDPGEDGKNLMGVVIPYPTTVMNGLKPGINVIENNGRIYSTIDGAFKIVKHEIIIDKCLVLEGDVDYSTGDVDFKGDLYIRKTVREGFAVNSEGDVIVAEVSEPANIRCKNNLTVGCGIVGGSGYSIEVGGILRSVYVENALIKSRSSIYIDYCVIKSNLYCLDKTIVGEKGSILGGTCFSQNGVIAGNIGNQAGVKTHIVTGIDYLVYEKLNTLQATSNEIVENMNKLNEKLRFASSREERDKIKYYFLSLKNRLNSLNNYSRSLLTKLDKNEKSSVIVLGCVYPETVIEICHIKFLVNKKMIRVEFYLDKLKGRINYKHI